MNALADHGVAVPSAGADRLSTGPIPSLGALVALTACVWLGSFLLSTFRDLALGTPDVGGVTLLRLGFAAVGALTCVPIHFLLRRVGSLPIGTQLAVALLASAAAALLYTASVFRLTDIASDGGQASGSAWQFYNTVYWAVFFLAWSSMHVALSYGSRLSAQTERIARAEALAHDAQLRALRYQVDPHFLFNALNSVSALVVSGRNEDAEEMLKRLSRFFRASVAVDPQRDVSLEEEVDLQRRFLEIEQVRYPDLQLDVSVAGPVLDARLPALILQPLVENAVRFGVASHDGPARIAIRAARAGDRVHIEIENSAGGTGKPGTGTGLSNVAQRLKARFGDAATMDARRVDHSAFLVQVRFPLLNGPAADAIASSGSRCCRI